jgi:CRP-like cAMP-binding protein
MTLAVMTRPALLKALRDDPDIAYQLMTELARMFRQVSKEAYH